MKHRFLLAVTLCVWAVALAAQQCPKTQQIHTALAGPFAGAPAFRVDWAVLDGESSPDYVPAVAYGTNPNALKSIDAKNCNVKNYWKKDLHYSCLVTGLNYNTKYYYWAGSSKCNSTSPGSVLSSYVTPPRPGDDSVVLMLGDLGLENSQATFETMYSELSQGNAGNLAIHVGDIRYGDSSVSQMMISSLVGRYASVFPRSLISVTDCAVMIFPLTVATRMTPRYLARTPSTSQS